MANGIMPKIGRPMPGHPAPMNTAPRTMNARVTTASVQLMRLTLPWHFGKKHRVHERPNPHTTGRFRGRERFFIRERSINRDDRRPHMPARAKIFGQLKSAIVDVFCIQLKA
jgi:hypothetical protein